MNEVVRPVARPAVLLLAMALLAVGCGALDPELTSDWPGDTEQSMIADGVPNEVAACVLNLAADDLARGPLSDVATEELVATCRVTRLSIRGDELDLLPDTELAMAELAWTLGDDPALDALWVACEEGSGAACDELFERSPVGSAYEEFGVSCGNRPDLLHCSQLDEQPEE